MDDLFVFNQDNYDGYQEKITRESARAIIFINNKILLIQSKKFGEYKMPGGGLKPGENDIMALNREVKEETGYDVVLDSVVYVGQTKEMRKSLYEEKTVFNLVSRYYICTVNFIKGKKNLSGYEIEYSYRNKIICIDKALKANKKILDTKDEMKIPPWTKREYMMLEYIKKNLLVKK